MGTSYQAFCITQRGLVPWPFGAQPAETEEEVEEAEGEGEGAAGAGGVAAPGQQRSEQPPAPQQ